MVVSMTFPYGGNPNISVVVHQNYVQDGTLWKNTSIPILRFIKIPTYLSQYTMTYFYRPELADTFLILSQTKQF